MRRTPVSNESDLLDEEVWDNPARLSDDDLLIHDLSSSDGPRSHRMIDGCEDWELA